MLRFLCATTAAVLASAIVISAKAATYVLPPPGIDVIGTTRVAYAVYEDTLMDVARDHGLGLDEILQANPRVDRWIPGEGAPVTLPSRFILPQAPRQGVVLNLAEKRLYYYPQPANGEKPVVLTYPIGIGRLNWETPLGETKIVTKVAGPDWRPPDSIKQEHLQLYNEVLPDVVPAGPNNPLGPYALRLGLPGYLIHGSNKRYGVGSRVSHGCIRMYNENIGELFGRVDTGTSVRIVNQPIKLGWLAGSLFVEVHTPLPEDEAYFIERAPSLADLLNAVREQIGSAAAARVDLARAAAILEQASGIPTALY